MKTYYNEELECTMYVAEREDCTIYAYDAAFCFGGPFALTIPEGIGFIGDCAFAGCCAIKDIKIADDVTYIGVEALCGLGATKVRIPSSIKEIGDNAFSHADVEEVEIPRDFVKDLSDDQVKELLGLEKDHELNIIRY